jgi:hypothetical protein
LAETEFNPEAGMGVTNVIQGCFPNGLPRVAQQRPDAVQLPQHLANLPRTAGQPLPAAVQQRMEAVFGARFSDVRVHVGPQAPLLGALSFTHGSNLYFAPGQYDPQTPRGLRMLARELSHVVQQRAGRVRNPFQAGVAVVEDRALQAEAERMAVLAARSAPAAPAPLQAKPGHGGLTIQRASTSTSQSCVASLTIYGETYNGSTGRGHGHAEMDALHQFVERYGADAPDVLVGLTTPVSVTCPSRPVCVKCSRVLQELGFVLGPGTVWGTATMGSTEWGCSLKVRDFLKACNVKYDAILAM